MQDFLDKTIPKLKNLNMMKQTFTRTFHFTATGCLLPLLAITFQVTSAQDFDFEENLEGLVVMEAENFTENLPNGTAEWAFSQEPVDYSGEGAMMAVTDGPFATADDAINGSAVMLYKINFFDPGTYYVWARASRTVDNPGGTDSYHAGINGVIPESATFINFESAFGEEGDGIWKWIMWSNPIGGQASIEVPSSGVHEFAVYIRENNFRIDKIVLSNIPYEDGLGYGPPADSIEETIPATGIFAPVQPPERLSFYPNPVASQIQVRIEGGTATTNRIGLFDMTGKLVRSFSADFVSSKEIDVSALRSGVYYMKLEQEGEAVSVQKLLKL
jgi:hypothetical protein